MSTTADRSGTAGLLHHGSLRKRAAGALPGWRRGIGGRSSCGSRQGSPGAAGRAVSFPEPQTRSEEHTSELQSLMRISYAVFCLKKKKNHTQHALQIQIC